MKYTVRPVTRPTATKPATTSVGSNKFQPVKVPGGLVSIYLDMYISIMPIEEITASDKGTCAKRLEREDYWCRDRSSCAPFTLMG